MKSASVRLEKRDAIAVITLNRPDQKNAIDFEMAAAFRWVVDDIRNNSQFRVVVVTGSGSEAFSVGTDPNWIDADKSIENLHSALRVTQILDSIDLPTIAAINGDAFGQGLELALSCDLRISTETCNFSMSQVSEKQIPWDGGTQRLQRVIGKARALEMILLGDKIDAMEALRINLVNRVVGVSEIQLKTLEIAAKIAEKGPIAVKYARESVNKGMDMTMEQGLRLEADLYFLLHTTRDRTEGIQAFHEKRKPLFKGK